MLFIEGKMVFNTKKNTSAEISALDMIKLVCNLVWTRASCYPRLCVPLS